MKKNPTTDESFEDTVNRHIKNLLNFCKSSKGAAIIVIMFFIIVIIMAAGLKDRTAGTFTKDEAEKKLASIITQIQGVEKAEVMITYESTSKKVPATTEGINTSSLIGEDEDKSTSKLFQGSTGQALIITELQPEIRGVVVVAKGADDYMVKLNIINGVRTVLNVSADKVEVLNMK